MKKGGECYGEVTKVNHNQRPGREGICLSIGSQKPAGNLAQHGRDQGCATSSATGGYNFGWVYKMAGIRFDGASETTEEIPNQRTVTKSTKGIESHFVWTYKPENSGTKVTVDIEYKVPVPLLGKLAESFIIKQNEQEADTLLNNLKSRMEV